MSWVPPFITDLAERLTLTEAAVLAALFLIMIAGLVLPSRLAARRRAYAARDDEFRRLQNM